MRARTSVSKQQQFIPGKARLFPNPVDHQFSLELNSTKNSAAKIQIIDISGHTVYQYPVEIVHGQNRFTVDVSHLAKGIYFVKSSHTNDFVPLRFVKL